MTKSIKSAVAAAISGAVPEAVAPNYTRAGSFASMVAELKVGDQPASRVHEMGSGESVAHTLLTLKENRDRLRNNVSSAVTQAKRRNPGADYSVEVFDAMSSSGIYVIALVWRNK